MNKSQLFKALIIISFFSLFLVSALPGSNKETITLTGAAFQPNHNCSFSNSGNTLSTTPVSIGGCSHFVAPVQFPDGITIEKITFYWKDSSVEHEAYLKLDSSALDGSGANLVNISTDGYEDEPSSSYADVSITVDNEQYGYFLSIQMPSTEAVVIYGVRIEYSVPFLLFLPFIRNSSVF